MSASFPPQLQEKELSPPPTMEGGECPIQVAMEVDEVEPYTLELTNCRVRPPIMSVYPTITYSSIYIGTGSQYIRVDQYID